jgi:hypothetical protein
MIGGRKIDFARGFALYRETLTPDRTVLLDRYRMMDVAFKAVGVGSVGTICVVGLFLSGDGEPLFLKSSRRNAPCSSDCRRSLPIKARKAGAWSRSNG